MNSACEGGQTGSVGIDNGVLVKERKRKVVRMTPGFLTRHDSGSAH